MVAITGKTLEITATLKNLVLYGVRLGTSMNDVSIYFFFLKKNISGWSLSWAPRKCQSQRVNFQNHILLHDIGIWEKSPMIFIEHRCTEPFFSAFSGGSLYTIILLVGGLEHEWIMTFHSAGNFIIPTDELIFFRGIGQPPTSFI